MQNTKAQCHDTHNHLTEEKSSNSSSSSNKAAPKIGEISNKFSAFIAYRKPILFSPFRRKGCKKKDVIRTKEISCRFPVIKANDMLSHNSFAQKKRKFKQRFGVLLLQVLVSMFLLFGVSRLFRCSVKANWTTKIAPIQKMSDFKIVHTTEGKKTVTVDTYDFVALICQSNWLVQFSKKKVLLAEVKQNINVVSDDSSEK